MIQKKPKSPAAATPKAEKKRAEILKAAARRFRKSGFHQTSMQEICTETHLGPGAVYRYFASKDAIIEAMADDERIQARAILCEMQEAASLDDALSGMTRAFSERYKNAADTGMMTEVYAEGLRNKRVGNLVRKTEAAWIAGLTDLLRQGQSRGQLDAGLDAGHTALLLTAMWDGLVIRAAYQADDTRGEFEQFFDAMMKKMLLRENKPRARTVMHAVIEPAPTADKDVRQMSLI